MTTATARDLRSTEQDESMLSAMKTYARLREDEDPLWDDLPPSMRCYLIATARDALRKGRGR